MKKKEINKKLLAFNFSNFALFNDRIYNIFKTVIKSAFDFVKCHPPKPNNLDERKTKKEIKRSSFHSSYTTSTSIDEKLGKKPSKKVT